MEIINATDGYKLGHHRMYPEGTQMVYSNWTPRSNRYFPEATEGSVVFGIQYFVKKYLIEEFNKWFALPKEEAIKQFAYRVGNFVDLNQVGTKHPKTDDGTKNSLKGLIRVEEENGKYVAYDQQTKDAELEGCLKTVFVNGDLVREYSLSEIRERVNSTL